MAATFDIGPALPACGTLAVEVVDAIDAETDDEKKLLCYSRAVASLRRFFSKYPGMGVTARMATVNSVLKMAFPSFWFVGFYVVAPSVDGSKEELVVGAYQGSVLACGRIALGKGVCGTAWAERLVQNVPDVTAIDNYVACDEDTLSECVVPVIDDADGSDGSGRVSAVLDVDSSVKAAFSKVDEECLAAIVAEFVAEPAIVSSLGDDGEAMRLASKRAWL